MFLKFLRQLGSGKSTQSIRGPADLSAIPALVQAGAVQEAERQLDAFLAANPGHPEALHFLGLLHHQTGRTGHAMRLLEAAVEASPADAFLRTNYAEVLRAGGFLEAALEQARQAVALDPESPVAAFNLATVLSVQQLPDKALPHALRALQAEPDSVMRLMLAASLHTRLDQPGEAGRLLERVRPLDPHHPGLRDPAAHPPTQPPGP
jgi:tetratricopeptide (TPR) repeat protein